ncbi:TVP38/TMEM64 family protein [Novosphingobium flavum]|uniref:TVP38/TMEM64 family membrane protein n=1 Tax=Novosphingobium flavum TaxID=1778672 RepID=A0A7X1FQF0_9SPHN|nr:VTT domain-containing protein [Novosphingobium flavum]MBC2665076.1 TVP38/TMEM64 family protein [Novosphingobium flavum]
MKLLLRLAGLIAVAVLAGGAMLARLPRSSGLSASFVTLTEQLQAAMTANWLAFALGQVLIAASGVLPASMLAMVAGASFGFGWGLAISIACTMFGGWVAFALSRTVLRGWVQNWIRRSPLADRFDNAISEESWRFVLLLRISPVMPFALTSYGLGLTRIGQRDFLLGTLASLPALVGYVAMGALGRMGMAMIGSPTSPLGFLMIALGLGAVAYALLRVKAVLQRVAEA